MCVFMEQPHYLDMTIYELEWILYSLVAVLIREPTTVLFANSKLKHFKILKYMSD